MQSLPCFSRSDQRKLKGLVMFEVREKLEEAANILRQLSQSESDGERRRTLQWAAGEVEDIAEWVMTRDSAAGAPSELWI